jgi:hypothetical protein
MGLPWKRRVCCLNFDRKEALDGDFVDDFGALLTS